MSSEANLLALPYEIREQIFQHYFKLDHGYFYDGESEKLVTADGQPIDLSLMYTCRSIADDTKHIPLSVNAITFSTVYREDWGLAEKHPAEFTELIDKALPGWTDSHSPDEFFDLTFDPWAIPSLSEVVTTADQLQAHRLWENLEKWHHVEKDDTAGNRYREKLYFSAAAVAIRFLDWMPKHQRLQMRNIIINEDRLAVGCPEGHVLGLIPFCRENPRLRVEQRVNLWRNLLLRMGVPQMWGAIKLAELGHNDEWDHKLDLYPVSSALASWGFHVMEVMGESMPAGTFSFVLDGDPDLNLSSDLFDTLVHPTVAWLKAYTECSSRGLFPEASQDIFYFPTAAYLEGIEPLLGGSSFLKTNFNVGQPWDYKKLAETQQDLPFSAWKAKYYQTGPTLDVSSPSINWINVRLELYEQQRESDYLDSSLNLCKREKKRLRRVRRRWGCIETEAEDDTEAGQRMRTLFGDIHKAPPCMTRSEKRMHRKERRAQKAAASPSDQTQEDLTDIDNIETTISGDFFEPQTGLWWW
ncbi:hypothetical protein NCS52_00992700 [Fusarium sp. LHS14.1]|nr:hypothetical protein NCS52_00992700 [Fusarium sp. LHS14.1]